MRPDSEGRSYQSNGPLQRARARQTSLPPQSWLQPVFSDCISTPLFIRKTLLLIANADYFSKFVTFGIKYIVYAKTVLYDVEYEYWTVNVAVVCIKNKK